MPLEHTKNIQKMQHPTLKLQYTSINLFPKHIKWIFNIFFKSVIPKCDAKHQIDKDGTSCIF